GYVETYLGDEFQKAFFKALKPFMFKTFRVEEDKIIQVMAMSSTLVRNLQEKRAGIHPDFVNSSIDKMRDLEAETVKRMQPVLGSSVRVDAYRRFERKFYETFVGTTTMKP
nr:hypothetical protein [Bdellovibrionales bacterium]